jgi:hypothetical protein
VGTESGKESTTAGNPEEAYDATDEAREEASTGTLNAIPEIMRRAVAMGLSGFFLTEEAIRKAVRRHTAEGLGRLCSRTK